MYVILIFYGFMFVMGKFREGEERLMLFVVVVKKRVEEVREGFFMVDMVVGIGNMVLKVVEGLKFFIVVIEFIFFGIYDMEFIL